MSDIDADKIGKRDRSPAFPFIPLKTAVDRLASFEEYFKRHPAPADKAGLAWGMAPKGSQSLQTVAALKAFGLLEAARGAQLTVSEEGRTCLRAQQGNLKRDILKQAALKPKQMELHWQTWGSDRPPDAICLDTLIIKEGFSQDGATKFLKVYDETIDFAGLSDSNKSELETGSIQREADEQDDSAMQVIQKSGASATSPPPTSQPPIGRPRIVMTGDHLDIQASVDLEGLKQLQTMLQKYVEILEMMAPNKDKVTN